MPFVPVPNTAMVELLYLQDSQQMENTLYVEMADPVSASEATVIAGLFIDWWEAEMAPLVSTAVQLRAVRVTSLESETAPSVEILPSPAVGGDATSPALPNNVTLAIKFNTALRGRSFRGRNYVVGLVEDVVTANSVSAIHVSALVAAYDLLRSTALAGSGATWVVVSRISNGVERATGVTEPVISVTAVDLTIDSQRRRLPGRGR